MKIIFFTLITLFTLNSMGQNNNDMNIENIKLYQERIDYPYVASKKRKTVIIDNMNKLKKGMTKNQVIELMTYPDEVNLTYEIRKIKSENNMTQTLGFSMVYILERKQKSGSVTEIGEKLIRIHFNNSCTLTWAYSVAIDEFDDIELKEKTNIKFIGEYYTGRGPCQLLPNGTRRWRYITGFKVKEPFLGNIQVNNIEINPNFSENSNINIPLEVGKNYMISLTLDKERIKILENKDTLFTHLNLITNDEIVEIIKAEDTNLRYGETIIIQKGYLLGNRSTIIDDTLILEPQLQGLGGATWIFEISNNELVIVDFRWNVRPNQTPQLHTKQIRILKGTNKLIHADLEYKTYSNHKDATNKENYVSLVGYVNQDVKVDIKRKYPYWSNIKDTDFVSLLHKYQLKIKSK